MTAILEIKRLTRRFGGLTAVDDLSFSVTEGEIRGLIGPNGAGKTTTFNVISGYYPPTSGSVLLEGREIAGLPTHDIAALGLVRTFQQTTLFKELSVQENMLIGAHLRIRPGLISSLLGRAPNQEAQAFEAVAETLALFDLADRRNDLAGTLPHGLQRALGMAIALMAKPRFLLLDEPFTGMNTEETREIMGLIRRVRDRGITLLLVEHDMQAVMGLCDRITVLNFGRLLTEGTPDEIRADPAVIEAYLGTAYEALAD
ncbi:MAG: ABC transporter ATP-binding protein [Geminicoccaceae bacterium]